MSIDAMRQSLEAAYLEGFNDSAEGYNGEYPFRDNGLSPLKDRHWIKRRDAYVRIAIEQAEKQEPVEYTTGHCKEKAQLGGCQLHNLHCGYPDCDRKAVATPPAAQRQPLTIAELRKCFLDTNTTEPLAEGWPGLERFARAVEAAHGIR